MPESLSLSHSKVSNVTVPVLVKTCLLSCLLLECMRVMQASTTRSAEAFKLKKEDWACLQSSDMGNNFPITV